METEIYLTGPRSKWPTYEKFAEGMRIRFSVFIPEISKDRPIGFLVVSNPILDVQYGDKIEKVGSNTIQLTTNIEAWGHQISFLKGLGWPVKYNEDMKDWYVGCLELNEENYNKTIEICKEIMKQKC